MAFYLDLHCLSKYLLRGIQNENGDRPWHFVRIGKKPIQMTVNFVVIQCDRVGATFSDFTTRKEQGHMSQYAVSDYGYKLLLTGSDYFYLNKTNSTKQPFEVQITVCREYNRSTVKCDINFDLIVYTDKGFHVSEFHLIYCLCTVNKQVSISRKCRKYRMQTNSRHLEDARAIEETQRTNNHMTTRTQLK